MYHCMLDLETMGQSSNAAIVSIGAILFNPEGDALKEHLENASENSIGLCVPHFYEVVSLECQKGIDSETIYWWLQQSNAAREAICESRMINIMAMLYSFRDWYLKYKPIAIWSHGATFDCVILANKFREYSMNMPWKYKDIRDTRTLFALSGHVPEEYSERDVKHHALQDAWAQVKMVQWAWKKVMAK